MRHESTFPVCVNRCSHRHSRLDRSGRVWRSEDRQGVACGRGLAAVIHRLLRLLGRVSAQRTERLVDVL
jgi:hypothetical protein